MMKTKMMKKIKMKMQTKISKIIDDGGKACFVSYNMLIQ